MFSVFNSEVTGFTSTIIEKELNEQSVQTMDQGTSDAALQTTISTTSGHQTDTVPQNSSTSEVNYDEQKLASFLSNVAPAIFDELNKIERSKAFSYYDQRKIDNEDSTVLMHTLYKHIDDSETVKVSCVSWSCTGNVIAIGSQSISHPKTYCDHQRQVIFYNINMSKFNPREPYKILPTLSCITCLTHHPYEPPIIAVGTYNGNIHIFDISKPLLNAEFENDVKHSDSITDIAWITLRSQIHLVTSSNDGFIFLFKVSNQTCSYQLLEKYCMRFEDTLNPGILCFSFSTFQEGTFICGLEGGYLYHCSTISATDKVIGDGEIVKDPTVRFLEKQNFMITRIEFSPYHENTFAVATGEDFISIYSLEQESPIYKFTCSCTINGIAWLQTQANLILCWGNSPDLFIYDTLKKRKITSSKPDDDANFPKKITALAINKKSPRLVAVGSNEAKTKIWEIPQFF